LFPTKYIKYSFNKISYRYSHPNSQNLPFFFYPYLDYCSPQYTWNHSSSQMLMFSIWIPNQGSHSQWKKDMHCSYSAATTQGRAIDPSPFNSMIHRSYSFASWIRLSPWPTWWYDLRLASMNHFIFIVLALQFILIFGVLISPFLILIIYASRFFPIWTFPLYPIYSTVPIKLSITFPSPLVPSVLVISTASPASPTITCVVFLCVLSRASTFLIDHFPTSLTFLCSHSPFTI
jgi:hypothetical protein